MADAAHDGAISRERSYSNARTRSVDVDTEHLLAADESYLACKNWLDAQEEEISNSMLVSALIFTVAAAAVLDPDSANIEGRHTDLYGGFCVVSLVADLASVLLGTIMRRNIRQISLHQAAHPRESIEFIQLSSVKCLLALPSVCMWIGTIAITMAILVNVHEVLGERSYFLMLGCSVTLCIVVLAAFGFMEAKRNSYGLYGRYDGGMRDGFVALEQMSNRVGSK